MPGIRHEGKDFSARVLASLGESILVVDSTGRIVHANHAVENLLGYSSSRLENFSLQELIPQFVATSFPSFFENVCKSREPVVLNAVEVLTRSKGRRTLAFSCAVVPSGPEDRLISCLIRDVTSQVDLQETILESRNKFRAALDSTAAWVVFVDRTRSIVAANKTFAYHLGVPIEKMVGKKCNSLMKTPACNEGCIADEVLLSGRTCQRDLVVRSEPFEEVRILSVTASPYVNETGAITGVVEIMLDVTRERRQQEEINYLKRLNEDIVQNAPMGIFATDRVGNITTCNSAWAMLAGAESVAYSLGANIQEFPVLQNAGVVESILTALQNGEVLRVENVLFNYSDGRNAMVNVITIPLVTKSTRIEGLVGLIEDVTFNWEMELQTKRYSAILENQIAERTAEANQAKRFLETVFETVENGIFTVDLNGTITSFNSAAERITGFSALEMIGSPCRSLWLECQGNCHLRSGISEIKSQQDECRVISKNGRALTLLKSVSLLSNEPACPVGLVESFVDITERENLRREMVLSLEQARAVQAELQSLSETKDNFIAFVSHELRTPLGAIKTFIDAMLAYPNEDAETKTEFLGIIRKEIERLVRLVNDLLDFSQLKQGTTKLQLKKADLSKLLDSNIKLFSANAHEKDLEIEFLNPGIECEADVDPDRVNQVFANLLSNALKFTPRKGKITVNLQIEEGSRFANGRAKKNGAGRNIVLVSIADTGVGIPPDQIDSLFEGFGKHSTGGAGRPSGAGLGLPICKSIVELHGGRIWVESQQGKGSVFKIALPLSEVAFRSLVKAGAHEC